MLKRLLLAFIVLISLSNHAVAEESQNQLVLANADINRSDLESIKRGAKTFASTCMSCHTLVYLRYDKLAKEAGITLDKMPINVATWPLGVKPPDLSLETDVRGIDWVYTYLHSFYQDSSRPLGVNNLLVPGTAMPAILAPLQGEQIRVSGRPATTLYHQIQWYDLVELTKQGSMTPSEFDAYTRDLVNFLAYAAEPYHMDQERIGYWVLGFIVVLFILLYILKREYWKDIKNKKD
jgi:ubiquinol-cytochrome c reductase cytochrome c1 subunit